MYTIRAIDFLENQNLVTDDNLGTDSTTEWQNDAAKTAGDLVKCTDSSGKGAANETYKIYEALQSSTGQDPTTDVGTVSPGIGTYWKEVGSVNEWAWANNVVADKTTGSGTSIELEITPGDIVNSIGFVGLDAEEINITITSAADGEVYNEDTDLTSYLGIDSFYDWLFEPIVRSTKAAFFDLPPYPDAVIEITISVGSGNPSVGAIILGQQFMVGKTIYGTRFGFDDYSRVDYVPELDRTIVTERSYSDEGRYNVLISDDRLEVVRQQLIDLRNDFTLWAGKTDNAGTFTFGIIREMLVTLQTKDGTYIDIEIGGLT